MDLGVTPFDELAVEPDDAFAIVEGWGAHRSGNSRKEVSVIVNAIY
jgi:hypothetical protein